MTELGPILARLGIDQYLDAFIGEGFDTWETVLDITESDLDALNVKLGHRRKLQREIANYRGVSYDRSLESPAQEAASDSSKAGESEAAFSLGQAPEKKPSGGHEGKRKYRRHPKPDENAPDRPPSAYVIFSNKVREDVKGQNLAFTEIAKLVGENWQLLTPSQKEPYEAQAATDKERHITELAEYKKTDSYKEYVQYLADFKAKHGVAAEGKRPKLERDTRYLAGGGSVKQSESSDSIPAIQPHSRRVSVSSTSHASSLPSPSSAVLPFLGHASSQTMIGHGQRTSPGTESPPPFMPPRSGMFNVPVPSRPGRPHSLNPESQAGSGQPPVGAFMDTKDTTGYQGYVSSSGVESSANTRHSSRMPAPLLHQDTTVSRSSLSSGLSSGSTSSISGIPRTPNDEPWVQRPGLIQGVIPTVDSMKGGTDYVRPFHPPLTSPFAPNYPTLPPPRPTDRAQESTSPIGTSTLQSSSSSMSQYTVSASRFQSADPLQAEYQRVDTYLRSLPLPTTGPPSSFSPSEPARHHFLRSNVSDTGTGQSPTTSTIESQPPNLPSVSLSDHGDPLAVLAYAGRLLGEERQGTTPPPQ